MAGWAGVEHKHRGQGRAGRVSEVDMSVSVLTPLRWCRDGDVSVQGGDRGCESGLGGEAD
jgi:hypothetical protein